MTHDLPIHSAAILAVRKPAKGRIAVATIMAIAALGAYRMHHRSVTQDALEPVPARAVANDGMAKTIHGPNSLFGAVCTDQQFNVPMANELGTNELDSVASVDLAGLTRIASASLDRADVGLPATADVERVASSDSTGNAISALSAVPEPTSAGLLLLVAAPAVSLRRRRA